MFPLWNRKALICVKVDIRIGHSFKTFKACRRTGQGCLTCQIETSFWWLMMTPEC